MESIYKIYVNVQILCHLKNKFVQPLYKHCVINDNYVQQLYKHCAIM